MPNAYELPRPAAQLAVDARKYAWVHLEPAFRLDRNVVGEMDRVHPRYPAVPHTFEECARLAGPRGLSRLCQRRELRESETNHGARGIDPRRAPVSMS
jgi:hypothetical protein